MTRSSNNTASEWRVRLCNPYAFLNDVGELDDINSNEIVFEGPPDVHQSRRLLEDPYAYLGSGGAYAEYVRPEHSEKRVSPAFLLENLLNRKKRGDKFSRSDIDAIVQRLHRALWKHRKDIWPGQDVDAEDALDPAAALQAIGFRVDMCSSIGQYSDGPRAFEVAGLINEAERSVTIAERFSPKIVKFTTAHELGHAILHKGMGLHRDRSQDGSIGGDRRDPTEAEAEYFAAVFLMPERRVRKRFKERFLKEPFSISEETAFALGFDNTTALENECRTSRDLARLLANAGNFGMKFFDPLTKQFNVSTEAMAIRLEELKLLIR